MRSPIHHVYRFSELDLFIPVVSEFACLGTTLMDINAQKVKVFGRKYM
jgi:hypothetical protein